MLIIGLTGGIASGKSLVAGVFRDMGAHVIDADRLAHGLLEPGQPCWREVLDHFGADIKRADNSIDRKKLGEIVFQDSRERAWLNACLHPGVFEAYTAQVKRLAKREPRAIVVLDAALLIETGYHKHVDTVVVVYADEQQQLARLMARDGLNEGQALARIRSQMSLAEKRGYADHVIDNSGPRARTEQQARLVFSQCRQIAERAG